MKTILFDLDGTLLPMSLEQFTKNYCKQLSIFFADLIDGKQLITHVLSATNAMLHNQENRRNEEVFIEHLATLIPGDIQVYIERFSSFYDSAFLNLQEILPPHPQIAATIKILKEKNYQLVVATNPIFPIKANIHRLNWAGLILTSINESPENCLLVGNDVQEDLAARKVGIKTYLIDDHIIHRGGEIVTDYRGSYTDFFDFAAKLPPVSQRI
ncbi:MAG: gph [Anaerospora sp.]|nr:gph [Anaerospora sp.]